MCHSRRFICQNRACLGGDNSRAERHHRGEAREESVCVHVSSFAGLETYLHRDGKAALAGFPAGISGRRESAAGKLEEVWPFSPYVLKGNWKTKLAETRLNFPPKKETELARRLPGGPRRRGEQKKRRRRGSEGDDGTPRSSRTVSGWLAVCRRGWLANSWRRRAEGAGL